MAYTVVSFSPGLSVVICIFPSYDFKFLKCIFYKIIIFLCINFLIKITYACNFFKKSNRI